MSECILFNTPNPVFESRLPSGCIAEYLFNDNLLDTSGELNNLTNHGITFANCELGGISKCGVFTGNAYAQASSGIFEINSSFSISLWAYIPSPSSAYYAFMSSVNELSNSKGVGFYPWTKDSIFVLRVDGTEASFNYSWTEGWHHIVVIVDTSAQLAKLVVDGVVISTKSFTGTISSHNYGLYIGRNGYGNQYYNGNKMTGLRLYNRTLAESDIAILYNNGQGV